MKIFDDYSRFWTVCCVIGLGIAAYLAVMAPHVLDAIANYVPSGAYSQKVVLLGVAVAGMGVSAIPLYALAKMLGIDIKDKKAAGTDNELDDIRNRS
jgi:hypothetical protein